MPAKNGAQLRRRWKRLGDERLLDQRMCDLGLEVRRTWLEGCVDRLYEELEERGLRFRPHVWLSTEWFSPDGIPGIAIPFYLAHPRLTRLETRQMLEAEGSSERSCMKLLRHEAGHAIDTAFRLHYRRRWRQVFGKFSDPYPQYYRPRPSSKGHVLHLDGWYAQAHPAEDWAETFAVWLRPRSGWRKKYADWPRAFRKLECVDDLMGEIAGRVAPVRSRRCIDPVSRSRMTLREYYEDKHRRYQVGWMAVYDRDLMKIFGEEGRQTAISFLRGHRAEIRDAVADWTGAHTYTIDQVLQDMMDRCRTLKLRLARSTAEARTQSMLLLTVHTMNALNSRRYEIPL